MSKDLFKVQKLTKSVKFMTSLNTGSNGQFQNELKFMDKVWKVNFLCYVFKYV